MTGSAPQPARPGGRLPVKVAGGLLLVCVSALVAVPLCRQEVWFSGPPKVTEWVGIDLPWRLHFWTTVIEEPIFFIIPGLALPAAIAFALDRRVLCGMLLGLLLGLFTLHYAGGRALVGGGDLDPWVHTHCRVDWAHTSYFHLGTCALIAALILVAWRLPERNLG